MASETSSLAALSQHCEPVGFEWDLYLFTFSCQWASGQVAQAEICKSQNLCPRFVRQSPWRRASRVSCCCQQGHRIAGSIQDLFDCWAASKLFCRVQGTWLGTNAEHVHGFLRVGLSLELFSKGLLKGKRRACGVMCTQAVCDRCLEGISCRATMMSWCAANQQTCSFPACCTCLYKHISPLIVAVHCMHCFVAHTPRRCMGVQNINQLCISACHRWEHNQQLRGSVRQTPTHRGNTQICPQAGCLYLIGCVWWSHLSRQCLSTSTAWKGDLQACFR